MVLFAKNNMGNNVTDLGSCRQQTTRRSTLPAFLRRKTLKQEIIYEDRPDYYFKLVLLGDAGSGKSTLAREFSCNACRAVYQKRPSDTDTKTVEFVDRIITCRKKNVLARLYDTAGRFGYFVYIPIKHFNLTLSIALRWDLYYIFFSEKCSQRLLLNDVVSFLSCGNYCWENVTKL